METWGSVTDGRVLFEVEAMGAGTWGCFLPIVFNLLVAPSSTVIVEATTPESIKDERSGVGFSWLFTNWSNSDLVEF